MGAIDGYVRVSRVAGREGESFISPGEQRKAIEGWARLHNRTIGTIWEDLDQSGKKRHRPGLDNAMGRVTNGESEGIIVAKLDRFGRSSVHLGELVQILSDHDAALFTVAEGLDTSGHTGRMIATILSAVAEFEVNRHTENWMVARQNAVERGTYVGGTVPLGYTKTNGRLSPGADAAIVREAFDRRASGESWGSISDWLGNQLEGAWSVGALRHLIANRTYLGEIHGGQGIVNLKGHEPLIDRATFEAANIVRGIAPARSGTASGLLAGLVRCASCRYALKYSMAKTRHGQPRRDYRCKSGLRQNANRCPDPVSVSSASIEPFVLDAFFHRMGQMTVAGLEGADDVEAAARHLAETEVERDAALDRRLADALGESSDAYIKLVTDRQRAVDKAREKLGQVRGARINLPDVDIEQAWDGFDLEGQRRLLASALDCVFVRKGGVVPDRAFICWRGDAPDLPVRGRRWTPVRYDFPA